MNSTHDTKDWRSMSQQMAASPVTHQSPQQQIPYPPMPSMEHHYSQSFPQGPMHPPVQHPSTQFMPAGKAESDPRLPGMMALSQPGTPRPSHHPSPTSKKAHANYTTSSFHAAPYAHAALARKRGRNELFSTELGPSFSSTKPVDNLYALDRSTLLNVRIQAKMDRGFFLADNDWTCYRRNYFQVSVAFGIHGMNHYYGDQETYCLVQVDGAFHPVHNFSMNISARVSNSDKKIELVQHTPKRDKGPQSTPVAKHIVPGGNLTMSSAGANQSIVTFERIQFKTATANNGKRRAAQQYYVCLIDLYAEIDGNKKVKVASCQSAPLVVRGRSPGHYSDNHDRYENNMSMSAPPPPQPQPQQQDERYGAASFPRPPITPPGVMGSEYGSPYPYQGYPGGGYPHFNNPMSGPMQSSMMPPTPTGGPPPQTTHQGAHNPYMVPSMTSDPSSSESSSPDLYNEFGHHQQGNNGGPNGNNLHEESKLNHPHPQQSPHLPHLQHGVNMHMPSAMDNNEWSRSRMNSASSHASYEPHSYFSQAPPTSNASQQSTFSNNSAPSTPYGGPVVGTARKYSITTGSIQQQQQAS